jgi:hypothetical protein
VSGVTARRPWFPFGTQPAEDDTETEPERKERDDAERELYAELEAREYVEAMKQEDED